MHILIAPDSFKESLPAKEVACTIRAGFERALPDASFDCLPLGDGGEGTVAALVEGLGLTIQTQLVHNALGELIAAPYATDGRVAVFEMAAICGLEQVPFEQRSPLTLSTHGVGEMLVHLAQRGMHQVMIGIGGSATNDGGIGMAAGLGYQFFDEKGQVLPPIGQSLGQIARIDTTDTIDLRNLSLHVLTDVGNPLCGSAGATHVFAGQKGLSETAFSQVDEDMRHFYELANPRVLNVAGAGAGGGMAAGLVTFAGGQIERGIDFVLDQLQFDRRVVKADLVIVGEGRMDKQSLSGKTPFGVARRTPAGIPIIAICGSLKADLPDFPVENIIAAFPIIPRVEALDVVLAHAADNLERTAYQIGQIIQTFRENQH